MFFLLLYRPVRTREKLRMEADRVRKQRRVEPEDDLETEDLTLRKENFEYQEDTRLNPTAKLVEEMIK